MNPFDLGELGRSLPGEFGSFALDCARAEEDFHLTGSQRAHESRLGEINSQSYAIWAYRQDGEVLKRWWAVYLHLRFTFLADVAGDGCTSDQEAALGLPRFKHRAEVLRLWRAQAADEQLAYLLRLEQLGSHELVRSAWYDDLPAFEAWARVCRIRQDESGIQAARLMLDGEAEEIGWVSRARGQRVILAALQQLRQAVAQPGGSRLHPAATERLRRLIPLADGPGDLDSVATGDEIAPIAAETVEVVLAAASSSGTASGGRDVADALIEFVRARFQARIADFLTIRVDPVSGARQLEFLTTTAQINDEATRVLMARQTSYSEPVGITGSVLLASRANMLFHVGTDDLDHDPRQSKMHRTTYEEVYGPLQSFWVFPVFSGANLAGAFRVVDRAGFEGENSWPFALRMSLCVVAQVASACLTGIGSSSAKSMRGVRSDAVQNAADLLSLTDAALPFGLHSAEGFLGLIGSIAQMKREDLSFGALVLLAPGAVRTSSLHDVVLDSKALQRLHDDVAASERDEFTSLLYHLPAMSDAGEPVIFLDETLSIKGVGRSAGALVGEALAMSVSQGGPLTGWIRPLGSGRCSMYVAGRCVGEYFLHEKLGRWQLRLFDKIVSFIQSHCQFEAPVIDDAFRLASECAFRHGKMIVVSPRPSALPMEEEVADGRRLTDIAREELYRLASDDGAFVLDSDLRLVSRNGRASAAGRSVPSLAPGAGTKHRAAAALAAGFPECLVFVSSANRGVTVFAGGRILFQGV